MYIIKFLIYCTIFYFIILYLYIFKNNNIFNKHYIGKHLLENFLLDIFLSFKILLLDLAFLWNCTKNSFLIVENFSINDDNFPNIISNIYFLELSYLLWKRSLLSFKIILTMLSDYGIIIFSIMLLRNIFTYNWIIIFLSIKM